VFSLASQFSVSSGFGLNRICINFPHTQKLMTWVHSLVLATVSATREGLCGFRNCEHFDSKVELKYSNRYIPAFNTNILIQTVSSVRSLSVAAVTDDVSHMKVAPIGILPWQFNIPYFVAVS
jgi:hypothetical protein